MVRYHGTGQGVKRLGMNKKNIEAIYPLTSMQQTLLLHALRQPKHDLGFLPVQCLLHGHLEIPLLKTAWERVISRHPVLRTSIHWEELEKPLQVVEHQVPTVWHYHDWTLLSSQAQQRKLYAWLAEARSHGICLNKAPLFHASIFQLSDRSFQLVYLCHHVLLDGWSGYLIIQDLLDAYQATVKTTTHQLMPAFRYQDYVNWLNGQDLAQARSFWVKQFQDLSVSKTWPCNRPVANQTFSQHSEQLSEASTLQLKQLCRQKKITLSTLLTGAWSLVVSAQTAAVDVVLGITVSGRTVPIPGIELAVGMFSNVLPLHIPIQGQVDFFDWLALISEKTKNYQ